MADDAAVDSDALELTVLPEVARAACYAHLGEMSRIGEAYQTLATWIEDNGYRTDGTARAVYLVSHPEAESRWDTELQMPITPGE